MEVEAFAHPEGSEGREQDADEELEGVFGDSREGAVKDEAEGDDDEERSHCAEAGGEERAGAACTDGDDDEDDFGAFEHGDVEGGGEGDLVPGGGEVGVPAHGLRVLGEGSGFVVKRDEARGSEDGFPQPAQAEEEQESAYGELKEV